MKATRPYANVYAETMNPFVRYDLDPHHSPRELTEQLRDRIEDASSDEERNELRAAWELLTKKPTERAFLSLEAGPDLRPPAPNFQPTRVRGVPPIGIDALPMAFLVPLTAHGRSAPLTDATLSSGFVEETGKAS